MFKSIFRGNDVDSLYDDAIDFLDENYAYFVTNVLNAGKPVWDYSIPTAAVVVPKAEAKTGKFQFVFNPDFAKSLSMEHFAFVTAHETMHVLLYHLTLSMNFENKAVFNIAADCVINDYLVSAGLDAPENLCNGEEIVGFNCSNSTVTEVYNIIENDPEIMKSLGLEGECDQCGGTKGGEAPCGDDCGDDCKGGHQHGNGKPCTCGGKFFSIDSHDWMHDPQAIRDFVDAMAQGGFTPENLPDDLEEILTEAVSEYEKTKMAGKGQGSKDNFMQEQKVTLKWVELLEKIDPDMFRMPGAGPKPLTSFRRPRRKLVGMYETHGVILPSAETPEHGDMTKRSDRKPFIVLALDTSGSIGQATANKFINLAKSIPQDKVEVKACTFTSSYMPLDLDNPKWRSGGTDFSPIEEFIRTHAMPENDNKYPSAVVVVTDGYASFYQGMKPSKDQAESWTWLLLDNHQKQSAKQQLSHYGFAPENFDTLDGYVDGNVRW